MKTYKDFEKHYIGSSDIASILVRTCTFNPHEIKFGSDGAYDAYIVPEHCEIGKHYELDTEIETGCWIDLFDDNQKIRAIRGEFEKVEIYRSGIMGCIIRLLNGSESLDNVKIQ